MTTENQTGDFLALVRAHDAGLAELRALMDRRDLKGSDQGGEIIAWRAAILENVPTSAADALVVARLASDAAAALSNWDVAEPDTARVVTYFANEILLAIDNIRRHLEKTAGISMTDMGIENPETRIQ